MGHYVPVTGARRQVHGIWTDIRVISTWDTLVVTITKPVDS